MLSYICGQLIGSNCSKSYCCASIICLYKLYQVKWHCAQLRNIKIFKLKSLKRRSKALKIWKKEKYLPFLYSYSKKVYMC
ncbi:unnamed protein product [Blepharisma stoltei]|uniref:Uncharacterized protein n=1 Tax=Blepharisma stoltei TaxID=1481888 RepID=A0AAU9JIK2_9CILI|nr:unnamed protein product [Blepharisma stoltei]